MKSILQSALVALFFFCAPLAAGAQTIGSNLVGGDCTATLGAAGVLQKLSGSGVPTCVAITPAMLSDPTHSSTLTGTTSQSGVDAFYSCVAGTDQMVFAKASGLWSRRNCSTGAISSLMDLSMFSGSYSLGSAGALTQTFPIGSGGVTLGYLVSVSSGSAVISTSSSSFAGVAMSSGTTGNVEVSLTGEASVYFAGAATAGNIAIANNAGQAIDSGFTSAQQIAFPTRILGRILAPGTTAAGLNPVNLDPKGAVGTLINTTPMNTVGTAYVAGQQFNGDTNTTPSFAIPAFTVAATPGAQTYTIGGTTYTINTTGITANSLCSGVSYMVAGTNFTVSAWCTAVNGAVILYQSVGHPRGSESFAGSLQLDPSGNMTVLNGHSITAGTGTFTGPLTSTNVRNGATTITASTTTVIPATNAVTPVVFASGVAWSPTWANAANGANVHACLLYVENFSTGSPATITFPTNMHGFPQPSATLPSETMVCADFVNSGAYVGWYAEAPNVMTTNIP